MTDIVHFYQTGTFTAGNRLLDTTERTIQASVNRSNSLTSGHRACQGCGEALGARYAVDAAIKAVNGNWLQPMRQGAWKCFRHLILRLAGSCHGFIHFWQHCCCSNGDGSSFPHSCEKSWSI